MEGQIDLVMGIPSGNLFPTKIKGSKDGDVCVYRTDFDSKKYLLAGKFNLDIEGKVSRDKKDANVAYVNTLEVKTKDFWTGE